MKVDKGVCTTNDAYFAGNNNNNTTQSATNELNSIIKFETVFTTLVENKILAIKRECEQHESKKKSRTLKNILLRKSNLTSASAGIETATTTTPLTPTAPISDSNITQIDEEGPKETDTSRQKEGKTFFFKYRKRPTKDDVEKGNAQPDNEQSKEVPSKVNDDDELVNVIVVPNESINQQHQHANKENDDKDVANAKLDSQSNELVIAADVDARNLFNLPVSNAKLITDDKQNNCDKLIINSHTTDNNNAQVTPSTNKNNVERKQNLTSSVQQQQQHNEELKDVESLELAATIVNNENDESLATTIDISLQQSSVVVLSKGHAGELPINNQINNSSNNNNVNDKSDVAICDDGLSSQNTSDIEFSLVSENSVSDLPEKLRKKVTAGVVATATVTNSDPIIKKSVNVISPPLTRHDKKPCERKVKSCQSTPIFGRHKHVRSESEGKKTLTFQRELPTKKYETKITDAVKSETIVIAPASTCAAIATITTTTLASKSIPAVSSGPLESVHMTTTKKIQKHSSKHRDVSIEYEITYDDDNENQSPHGFISSFNQLTSQKQPAAIISANLKKQTSKQVKGLQAKDSIKSQHETEKTVTNQEVELELDELNVDVVNKKKRRRSKYNKKVMVRKLLVSAWGRQFEVLMDLRWIYFGLYP